MIQEIINRAVNIATKRAMLGRPVEKIIWIPSQSASSDPMGAFAIQESDAHDSATKMPTWMK